MLSLFENTASEVTVHILHDNTLPAENREKFIYIAGRYGQHVKFYNVDALFANEIDRFVNLIPALKTAYSSIATMYRFFIPQLLSPDADKCIYLDSDNYRRT